MCCISQWNAAVAVAPTIRIIHNPMKEATIYVSFKGHAMHSESNCYTYNKHKMMLNMRRT